MGWPNESQRHAMSAKGIQSKQLVAKGVGDAEQEMFIAMAQTDARLDIALKNSSDSSVNLHQAADDIHRILDNKNIPEKHRKGLKKMMDDLNKLSDAEGTNWQRIYNLREAHKEVRRQILEGK